MTSDFILLLIAYIVMTVTWLLSRQTIKKQRSDINNLNKVILGLLEAQRGPD